MFAGCDVNVLLYTGYIKPKNSRNICLSLCPSGGYYNQTTINDHIVIVKTLSNEHQSGQNTSTLSLLVYCYLLFYKLLFGLVNHKTVPIVQYR